MSAVSRQSSRFWVLAGVAATPSSWAMALMRRASAMSRSVTPRESWLQQPHQDGRPRQRHVGVVVGLLGGGADARDELEARREAVGLVPRLERAHDQHPVGEALVLDLGGGERGHRQHGLSDGARVRGDLPAEPRRVGEVAGVAAPLALLGFADVRRPGRAGQVEGGVHLLARGHVVGQRDRHVAVAAADRADLPLEPRLRPQGEHQLVADLDHQHVALDLEGGLPAEPVDVEGARGVEVGHGQGDEADAGIHQSASRPCQVQTQTLLPSGSASTVHAGARSVLISVPPAARAASIRDCAWSGGTVTSTWNRCRGSSCASVSWNQSSDLAPVRVDHGLVLRDVVAQHRRPEPRAAGMSAVSRPNSSLVSFSGRRRHAQLGRDLADPPGHRDVAAGDAAGVVADQTDVDEGPGEGQVGVVVGLLGRGADAVDELEAGREPTRLVPRLDHADQPLPVGELLGGDLLAGQLRGVRSHAADSATLSGDTRVPASAERSGPPSRRR